MDEELKKAADEYATRWHENPDGSAWKPLFEESAIKAFIAGAKWQAEHTPFPEDTVLFNKGVAEGKRLMMEEAVEADVNTYRDLAAGKSWAEFVVEMPTNNLGDKVRIIIVKED